jgi:hypothetical protein
MYINMYTVLIYYANFNKSFKNTIGLNFEHLSDVILCKTLQIFEISITSIISNTLSYYEDNIHCIDICFA